MLAAALGCIESNEDKKRFAELYNTYKNLMYRVAFDILQNPHDAEEALQEAFFSIAKNFSNISEINCPQTKGFVVIVIRNYSYNMLKKIKRQRRHEADPDLDELEILDETSMPEEKVLEKYSVEALESALRQIPQKYYDIIYLTYYMDYSINDVSKFLGITYENAKKRLNRARERLADILKENGYEQS